MHSHQSRSESALIFFKLVLVSIHDEKLGDRRHAPEHRAPEHRAPEHCAPEILSR